MSCLHCTSENHLAASCPFKSGNGGPYVSLDATPNRVSAYHGENRFEKQVATTDRNAYQTMVRAGRTPDGIRGAASVLRKLGG